MAKETPIEQTIPRLYKRNALYLLMFGYIRGCRDTLHTMTIEHAIRAFMSDMELEEDDFNFESAKCTYFRMCKDLKTLKQ